MAVRYPGGRAPKHSARSREDGDRGVFRAAAGEQVAGAVQVDLRVRREPPRAVFGVAGPQQLVEPPEEDVASHRLVARDRLVLAGIDVRSAHQSSQVTKERL